MPATLTIRFAGFSSDVTPRHVLGAVSSLCETPDSDHQAHSKPFAAGPVVNGDDSASWRLGWLVDGCFPPGWPPSQVRFGGQVRPVAGFDGQVCSYADLARSGSARRVRLTMLTPTFFSRNGRDLPLPEPVLTVRGLLARWNSHAPHALRIGDDDAKALVGAVFLDEASGATKKVEVAPGLRQVGFVGRADLRLLTTASEQTAAVFGALARFAAFAGVGAQTTSGFGAVDVEVEARGHRPSAARAPATKTKAAARPSTETV